MFETILESFRDLFEFIILTLTQGIRREHKNMYFKSSILTANKCYLTEMSKVTIFHWFFFLNQSFRKS